MDTQPKSTTISNAKRLQIRGFPKIWADKLSCDEIGWILFDKLVQYGAIDNISVTLSKKGQLFGIVDMLRKKDVNRVFSELLDENGHLRLQEWNSTLQFKLLDADSELQQPAGKQQQQPAAGPSKRPTPSPPAGVKPLPLREVITNLSSVNQFATRIGTEFGQKMIKSGLAANKSGSGMTASGSISTASYSTATEGPVRRYGREEMLELQKYATPNFRVDPEFFDAFRMCRRWQQQPGRADRQPKKNNGGNGREVTVEN